MRKLTLGIGAALWVTGAAAAAACQGGEVLFADDFETFATTWGDRDDAFYPKDGHLVISPSINQYYAALNTAGIYDDIDYCVSVTALKADAEGRSFAGPIFWAADTDNYYCVLLATDGTVGIFRRQRGKTLVQADWANAAGAKSGVGEENRIRVVTVGKEATVYINGKLHKKISGKPPEDGQEIGVRATSPKKMRAVFAFDDLEVTAPAASP